MYEFRLLPVRIEGWCQGQGSPPQCPSEKVLRVNQWARVLMV